jgi:hypothetical protein
MDGLTVYVVAVFVEIVESTRKETQVRRAIGKKAPIRS